MSSIYRLANYRCSLCGSVGTCDYHGLIGLLVSLDELLAGEDSAVLTGKIIRTVEELLGGISFGEFIFVPVVELS